MTHAAPMNAALFFFLVFLTLLLVMFIGAVIMAPTAPPGSPAPPAGEAPAPPGLEAPMPPPAHVPVPLAPLPRRPVTTATTASTTRWPDADVATDVLPPVYNEVRRPMVSSSPPWGPAPRPPGPDPWAAENPAPSLHQWPEEEKVSPPARRPAGTQARYPRHGRGR
jgi:hypothetical protein